MGLDQYIYKVNERYPNLSEALTAADAFYDLPYEVYSNIKQEERPLIEIAYWRKCSLVHDWFTFHCKKADESDYASVWYLIDDNAATQLVDNCKRVLDGGIYAYRDGKGERIRVETHADNEVLCFL